MATFKELADCMSTKSATPDEDRLTISLHRLQLFRWWKKQGGKEKSSIEKPRLTPECCRKRLDWIEKWEDITTDPNIPVPCLDEKWFYTATRRRKIKMLPLSDEELSSPNLASIHPCFRGKPENSIQKMPCQSYVSWSCWPTNEG